MKCIRFHDNKHEVISTACQALGSLVMNGKSFSTMPEPTTRYVLTLCTMLLPAIIVDLVKETVSSPELALELLGLIKRYHASQAICRGALVPLGFLVTDGAAVFCCCMCIIHCDKVN